MRFCKGLVMGMVLAGGLAVAACAGGGAGGDDPSHGGVAPVPTAAMAARSGHSLDTVGRGYWVFQRKCSECHVAKLPENPHEAGWHATAAGMAWNAGLSKSEEKALLAYIAAVKK